MRIPRLEGIASMAVEESPSANAGAPSLPSSPTWAIVLLKSTLSTAKTQMATTNPPTAAGSHALTKTSPRTNVLLSTSYLSPLLCLRVVIKLLSVRRNEKNRGEVQLFISPRWPWAKEPRHIARLLGDVVLPVVL